jgi:hypothetical protein
VSPKKGIATADYVPERDRRSKPSWQSLAWNTTEGQKSQRMLVKGIDF